MPSRFGSTPRPGASGTFNKPLWSGTIWFLVIALASDLSSVGNSQIECDSSPAYGGLTEAKRIVDLALASGAMVCPGNWSTQILGAASVHLALYSPITPLIEFAPAEIFESPLRMELQLTGLKVIDGLIEFPTEPGIGYDLSEELVNKFGVLA